MKHSYNWQDHIGRIREAYSTGMRWGFALGISTGACAMAIVLLAVTP